MIGRALSTRWPTLVSVCFLALLIGSCGSDSGSRSYTAFLTCDPSVLFSDGSTTASCAVRVQDQNGAPATSGTRVVFLTRSQQTNQPSGGFGPGVDQMTERFLSTTGAATVDYRCNQVGTVLVIAAPVGGVEGVAQIDCADFSGDWEIVRIESEFSGIRPGEATEIYAWAETGSGDLVPPGTDLRFTTSVDSSRGGFGGSLADSRTASTDGNGRACVTFVAAEGDFVEQAATVTAAFDNTNFGDSTLPVNIRIDPELPVNDLICMASPETILADGQDTSIISCTAYGQSSEAIVGATIVCDIDGGGALSDGGRVTTSSDGSATLTFTAGATAARSTITCDSDHAGEAMSEMIIDMVTASGVESLGTQTSPLGVLGSGFNESTSVCFQITDNNSQSFFEGHPVQFDIVGSTSEGATLLDEEVDTDDTGQVCTTVRAGNTYGTVEVNARVRVGTDVSLGTETLNVVGVVPSRGGMSVTCTPRNIGAFRYGTDPITLPPEGHLCTTCELRLADAAGNDIGIPTTVTFATESGSFDGSGQTENNINGIAQIRWCANGNPPRDVLPFVGQDEPSWVDEDTGDIHNPRDGLVTIIAYVNGDEELDDANGDGMWNGESENHWSQSEPYIDANDNNVFDDGEQHVDVDGGTPGEFDDQNGVWDQDTIIWVQTRILLTGSPYFDTPDEFSSVSSGAPVELAFDDDYPDSPRLSHWYIQDTAEDNTVYGNFYRARAGDTSCPGGPNDEYCFILPATFFENNRLNVYYVMRDINGNPVNLSLLGVTHQFDLLACNGAMGGAINVESTGYDPGLRDDSEFPFVMTTVRTGEPNYQLVLSEFGRTSDGGPHSVGSVQTFSLTKGAGNVPGGGCQFRMAAPLRACPDCGDPPDTAPWPYFIIND